MDRERVIFLVEKEISRLEASAIAGGFFAKDNLEMSAALREVLESYKRGPTVFREHHIRPTAERQRVRKRM